MKTNKIIGYILLIVGLLIITFAIYSSFNIFTAKKEAPPIFKLEEKEVTQKQGIQEQVSKVLEEKLKEMIPPNYITKLLNLMSWSILAGILIFGGGKIAGLGINLIK